MNRKWSLGLSLLGTMIVVAVYLLFNGGVFIHFNHYFLEDVNHQLIVYSKDQSKYYQKGIMTKEEKILYKPKYEINACGEIFFLSTKDKIMAIHKDNPKTIILEVNGYQLRNNQYQMSIPEQVRDYLRYPNGTIYNEGEYVPIGETDCFINDKVDYLFKQDGTVIEVDQDYFDFYPNNQNGIKLNRVMSNDKKMGFIDPFGSTVIEPKYDYAWDYTSDGLAVVKQNNTEGVIDVNENVIISTGKYDYVNIVNPNLFIVKENDLYQLINKQGETLTTSSYDYISTFTLGYAVFSDNDLFGVIEESGDIVVENKYKSIILNESYLESGLIPARFSKFGAGKWGFLDKSGNVKIDFLYQDINRLHVLNENLAVYNGVNWGLIDFDGNTIKEFNLKQIYYNTIYNTNDATMIASNDNYQFGIYDLNGNEISQTIYTEINNFVAKTNEGYFLLNEEGKSVTTRPYNEIFPYGLNTTRYYRVRNERYGVIKSNGEVVLDSQYDVILTYDNDSFILNQDGKLYFADSSGLITEIKPNL